MVEPWFHFHRPMPVHDLPAAGRTFAIEASPEERLALAQRFDIPSVDQLRASGVVRPEAGGRRVKLDGRLEAAVVQTCVVTLEPVPASINADFERFYGYDVLEEEAESVRRELFLDLSDDLPVEPLSGDLLDLGAAVAEQLALELDPYPRRPGAIFTGCDVDCQDPDVNEPPGDRLALLAKWRARREGSA